jgi:hypothetical protein
MGLFWRGVRGKFDNDDARLGLVPPGKYKARWDREKLKALFFGRNGKWNELAFTVTSSFPMTPEMERELSDESKPSKEPK